MYKKLIKDIQKELNEIFSEGGQLSQYGTLLTLKEYFKKKIKKEIK